MAADGGGSPMLWRECIRWLVDLGILRSDHRIVQSGNIQEFATLLRDGVLLCRLINELVPNAVDDSEIHQQHNILSEFQSQKMICRFLGACQRSLSLKEGEMFSAWELYQLTDFAKVLNTLSLISRTEAALRRGVGPFPSPSSDSPTAMIRATPGPSEPEEEDIYRNLQNDVDNVEVDQSIYDCAPYRNMYDEDTTKIYDHIVARQDSRRESRTDVWSTFQPTTKREHCIKELLDTEKNYVEKALNMIINKFYSPLEAVLKERGAHQTIFMNIVELWNLHTSFHNDLRQAVYRTLGLNSPTDRPSSLGKNIGEVFLLHKDKFIAYGPYCMGLDASRAKIIDLDKNDQRVKARITECCSAVNDNQFKLQDLLCLPLQRVLKYHILLSEMIKATSVEATDRKSLELAKEAMEDINAYVNEMKRDHETCQLIMDVEKSIVDVDMPPDLTLLSYGRLHADGEVRLAESTDSTPGKLKQRHLFLFDKVLIICQGKRNNTFLFKGAHAVNELTLDTEGAHSENKFGTITKKLGASQHILHFTRDSREDRIKNLPDAIKLVSIAFKNRAQMEKWMEQFQAAKDNVNPKCSGHKLHYQTFDKEKAHKCSLCERFLKGLIFQGYSCEACDNIFHKACVGLRPCPGRRQPSITANASFSHATDLNHRRRRMEMLSKGEQVVGLVDCFPKDPTFLQFNANDSIEVIESNQDGSFLGCLVNNRSRVGRVNCAQVRRLRANSMINVFGGRTPLESPTWTPEFIDRKASTILPQRPPITPLNQPEYMNTEVNSQVWYMGNMERNEAERKLKPTPNGTFLVRYSNNRGRYALSISYDKEVKHTIIEQTEDGLYYLDEGYVFNSIVELINYYKTHNMNESFNTLNTTLKNAYRDCKVFRVIHDFEQSEQKFLNIRKGDILTLIDTVGEDRGWWKGTVDGRTGFFPMSYVEELKE